MPGCRGQFNRVFHFVGSEDLCLGLNRRDEYRQSNTGQEHHQTSHFRNRLLLGTFRISSLFFVLSSWCLVLSEIQHWWLPEQQKSRESLYKGQRSKHEERRNICGNQP